VSKRGLSGPKVMSFGEHLEDLRRRVGFAMLGLLPILLISMYYGKAVMAFLLLPAAEAMQKQDVPARMLVTGLLEGFNSYFYLALILTILIGAPWLLYQLWLFIAPGLYSGERRFVYLAAPLSAVLAIVSALFTYYVMLPAILSFFVHFNLSMPTAAVATAPVPANVTMLNLPILAADPESPEVGDAWINRAIDELRICVQAGEAGVPPIVVGAPVSKSSLVSQQYQLSKYIDLLFNFALAFAAGFQMPVVVLLLGWVGIVTPEFLVKYRRHAIMVCAILGAALTPGDPISAVLMGVPLYILFELGLFLLRKFPASRVAGKRPEVVDEPPRLSPSSPAPPDPSVNNPA